MALLKKSAATGRKAFVRTRVPRGERIAGVAIVSLLAAIAVVIAFKGQRFDPNIYSLRTEALNFTSATVEGKQATVREKNLTGFEEGAPASASSAGTAPLSNTAPTQSQSQPAGEDGYAASESGTPATLAAPLANEPLEVAIAGLKPMGPTEFYSADNLFEKIDGRAPAYLAFSFKQLRNRSFSIDGTPSSFVDLYEFRMDNPVNAFGAFAMERDPKGSHLDFAPDGYSGAMGFYFRQGSVYVQVIASDQDPKTLEMTKAVAQNRAKAIPVDDAGLEGRRKLPSSGLVPDSISFVLENAQGQEFLKNVFQAVYQFESKKLPFFIMSTTPDAAAKDWASYQTFCAKFGGEAPSLPEINGAKIFKAKTFGTWKVIYYRQSSPGGMAELGGIFDAQDGEKAQKFIEQYLKGEIQ